MNVYLMVDIEGISGIYTREQVVQDGKRFAEGRRRMTEDINATVAGLKDAGIEKIYVRDCHGGSYSVLYDELSPDVDYVICGKEDNERYPGLDECDAVILLGYHAMAGTAAAVLEHSFSSASVQNITTGGERIGELYIDAAIAGEHGKPIIMVSGDDKLCLEAKRLLPNVVTAEVKRGLTCFGAMLLPRERAHALLRERAREAVERAGLQSPFTVPSPVSLTVEYVERTQLASKCAHPGMIRDDGRTVTVTAPTMEIALFRALY